MAGKVDDLSPSVAFQFSPPEFPRFSLSSFGNDYGVRSIQNQYFRSQSSNDSRSIRKNDNDVPQEYFEKWRIAMQCKVHVGTKEWVRCDQSPCLDLREELRHLQECPYSPVGGCEERCLPLRKQLRHFRHSHTKYATISQTQSDHRHRRQDATKWSADTAAKLQALRIERFIAEHSLSPNSPVIEEPFQRLEAEQKEENEEETVTPHVVELVPLDKAYLSVVDGCFRRGKEWERLHFLGKGTFGKTYLCYDKNNQCQFAIKKLCEAEFEVDEVDIWKKLNDRQHPNILRLFGAVKRQERVLIFMEYMNGGSVGDFLSEHGSFSEKIALPILYQVLNGLHFMHSNNIVHGDIKGANVLMDELGLHVKLADFGSCINLELIEQGFNPRLSGTLAFMSPESCRSELPSFSSDIWSVMCFLIQMLSGQPPWSEYRHQIDALNPFIIGSAQRGPNIPKCSTSVQDLFNRGFKIEANSRPSAAQLLLHQAFVIDLDAVEPEYDQPEAGSFSKNEDHGSLIDSSHEYHSSPSFMCSDDELSGDEYLSFEDNFDNIHSNKSTDSSASKRVKAVVTQRVDEQGVQFGINNLQITVPPEAVTDPVQLNIECLDPLSFYQPLINHDLYEEVQIVGDVYQFCPCSQEFLHPVEINISLPEHVHQSEYLAVFHGRSSEKTGCIYWDDITENSTITSFSDSVTVDVNIDHFSYLMILKSLTNELIFKYSAMVYSISALFRFLVVARDDPENPNVVDARLITVRESFYLNSCEDTVDQFSVCRKLKDQKFRLMYGSRREYVVAGEALEISLNTPASNNSFLPEMYKVQCTFGGEEVCQWTLNRGEGNELLSGTVIIKRNVGLQKGLRYSFHFWEHEPTRYVQKVLQLKTLTFLNILPVAKALDYLETQLITQLVEELCGDEEEQLKRITQCWEEGAEHNELGNFRGFVGKLSKQAILVSDRGKFHLGHLIDFKEKWEKKSDRDGPVEGNEKFFEAMADSGKGICHSVFSDCLLQMDQSDDSICTATNFQDSLYKLIEHVKLSYPDSARHNFDKLWRLVGGDATCNTSHNEYSQRFCQQLFQCVPWLSQIVKDLFTVEYSKSPSGMWGVISNFSEGDKVKGTEELLSNETWCRISELLGEVCKINLQKAGAQDVELNKIIEMDEALNVAGLLENISIHDKEWDLLKARVKYYGKSVKDITRNSLHDISRKDLQNVLFWLERYVKFCPTKLVQFSFSTMSTQVAHEPLEYDQESKCFVQKFILTSEKMSDIKCSLKVHIDMNDFSYNDFVHVMVTACEQNEGEEEVHLGCTTVNVLYQHHQNGKGNLKVVNDCQKLFVDRAIESHLSETDGRQTERTIQVFQQPLIDVEVSDEVEADGPMNEERIAQTIPHCQTIKKGCPSDLEIEEIANNVPNKWKSLGRLLLGDDASVNRINIDEAKVADKAMEMLKKWKQKCGNQATYVVLYNALCSETVSRNDVGDKYCLERNIENV